ncbi:YcnI family protein [Dactylosporangium matsuzakiense]|uniref:YncI copper-binding domain-containing protein n=1 Tax=Dactylosporangium matsuzakiense TaxID=53360 RepID=A0A9W6KUJ8_9ACTN|nr:YcnI family protein [Dactylosporangium matsuzakiense]UWZ41789.1 DUF1775 domain-containing protein [Dactylosporangium matsuzakiense]GLL06964.1 hypothetical protein GCM10017581_087140 [Dactylosporangium matsuzakiense]
MLIRRALRTVPVVLAATVAGLLLTALPAAAHVEVKADKAQAGAADVTVSFSAEGESSKAGIASVKVALPAGIAPADVSYVSGPAGWTLAADADGYTVSGPALAAKKNADYVVKVAKLPADAKELTFKTLVNYTDGKVDRWIDAPGTDNPAPVLKLAAAAPAATTTAPSAPATSAAAGPTTEAAATTAITEPADAVNDEGDSSSAPWVALAVVVVVALAAVLFFRYRRRNSGTS